MHKYTCARCGAGVYTADTTMTEVLCAECEREDNLVEVVRCRDCRHKDTEECPAAERQVFRNHIGVIKERTVTGDHIDYCSCGERGRKCEK